MDVKDFSVEVYENATIMCAGLTNAVMSQKNERDAIGKRRKPEVETEELLDDLLKSEKLCQQLRSSVIKSTEQVSYDCGKVKSWRIEDDRRATLDDVGKSIHQQLVLLVEWAKSLPQFTRLSMDDQVTGVWLI
ncbi:hypothetical protein COOONC_25419 [Cooperia oncophora]